MSLPLLTDATLADMNCIAAWLAVDDFSVSQSDAQAIVLMGNGVIQTLESAFILTQTRKIPLWLSGGIGHSTAWLARAISSSKRYNRIATAGRAEADVIRDMAVQVWHLPEQHIYVENASSNTGENALFTDKLMAQQGFVPEQVILMQDPLLQRRTSATFQHVWRERRRQPIVVNYPGYQPHFGIDGRFVEEVQPWPFERFFSLLMGEVPRLRDDGQGYGPKGQGFITHVDIPDDVEQAWKRLLNCSGAAGQERAICK
ncbi:YdcF family protein [Deinococcus hopiensis]|uniref:Uncharacterized SAM-binding protein YcdF, DUF218 family n=1 Tax=Deinococcus hopiensis KR-140 TaxID=695939 RepID=A0A1W1USI1_9DEIO|nr:YdcF family protein [Deinococcus hopiensis]SMB84006.1 Uncharacterized SAM-binding protein YcdF, DUF218 family [Deinococcus hopiensis KR-140]